MNEHYAITHPTRGYYVCGTQDLARWDWNEKVARKWRDKSEANQYAFDCLQAYYQATLTVTRVDWQPAGFVIPSDQCPNPPIGVKSRFS